MCGRCCVTAACEPGDPSGVLNERHRNALRCALLKHVDFPTAEVLGPGATEDEIQDLIDRHKLIFIKPLFKGGVGKKGKSGLIGRATDLKTALAEKERLYFAEHRHGNAYGEGERRDLRRRRAGRARGLFRDHGLDRVSRADDDADPHGRHGHRGARQEPGRDACRSMR